MKKLILTMLVAAASYAADLTGTWAAEVQLEAGTGTPTFEIKQQGDNLTGTYTGQLGTAPLKGTLKGKKVRIEFSVDYSGQQIAVIYAGTMESDTEMKGTVDFAAGQMTGTFTAKKK
jgi:hypothetical protein